MITNREGKTHDDLEPLHSYVTFRRAEDRDYFIQEIEKKNYIFCWCIPCGK